MQETIIDLIRHGEPVGGSRYRGHNIDDPLSEKGWQQMWSAVGKRQQWQHIISSPMQRCRDFAEALAQKQQLYTVVVEDLKEIGFGSWEGKTRQEVKTEFGEAYNAFYQDPVNARPQGAENLDSFISRVCRAYDDVVAKTSGKHSLIVAHAGVIRAIVAHTVCAAPRGLYNIQIDNGGITRIQHGKYGASLLFLNRKLED
ncbi:MAG: histidine phosphatase family protein [Gammaproteobacteria bacterium]|nr:histidine phosphatase family protein [Gammaproteobacteria bacterium]